MLFYTDPHLGVTRAANTTQGSSAALQKALYDQASAIVANRDLQLTLCLGDLFDNFSNPEPIHLQGMQVMSKTALTIAGNHDVANQANKMGTLELLNNHFNSLQGRGRVFFAPFGESAHLTWMTDDKHALTFVPHVASQELFLQSLLNASEAMHDIKQRTKILCLHCNYNFPDERLNETTLNLTEDTAKQLLDRFDYILMGHEHIPAEHYDGRLIILGNTHPTSLSDISDKRIAFLENKKIRFETVWSKADGYVELQASRLPDMVSANFARVQGEVDAGGMLDVMKHVSAMWRRSPNLYVLKMEVTMAGAPQGDTPAAALAQLPAIIRKELEATPELLKLWDELQAS